MTTTTSYRLGALVALGTALVLLFGVAALGIVGDGGPWDLLYVGALAVGLVGAVVARFRAGGMAVALGATAAATVVAGAIALVVVLVGDDASVLDLVGLTGMFAVLFAVSAWLFRRSAELEAALPATGAIIEEA